MVSHDDLTVACLGPRRIPSPLKKKGMVEFVSDDKSNGNGKIRCFAPRRSLRFASASLRPRIESTNELILSLERPVTICFKA